MMQMLSGAGSDNLVYVFACRKKQAQSISQKLANTHTHICTHANPFADIRKIAQKLNL